MTTLEMIFDFLKLVIGTTIGAGIGAWFGTRRTKEAAIEQIKLQNKIDHKKEQLDLIDEVSVDLERKFEMLKALEDFMDTPNGLFEDGTPFTFPLEPFNVNNKMIQLKLIKIEGLDYEEKELWITILDALDFHLMKCVLFEDQRPVGVIPTELWKKLEIFNSIGREEPLKERIRKLVLLLVKLRELRSLGDESLRELTR